MVAVELLIMCGLKPNDWWEEPQLLALTWWGSPSSYEDDIDIDWLAVGTD